MRDIFCLHLLLQIQDVFTCKASQSNLYCSPDNLVAGVVQALEVKAGKSKPHATPFQSTISNFYQTDVISRTSVVMAKCVQARKTQFPIAPPAQ
jgi:NADH-ubiquinone oxidoreductase subunit G, C-terminal